MFTQQASVSAVENIGTVAQVYDGTLTSDIQINTFRNIDRLFPVRVVKHGPHVLALPPAAKPMSEVEFSSCGKTYDLIDYMALNRVTALLVLKDGHIASECYEMGNSEQTRWMSMSMAKSITSSLVGAAIRDGHIQSIDDPVTQYVAKLRGSAYDGVSIRHLLQMASGVKWDETYANPASDRRRMLEAQIAQRPGAIMDLLAKLPRAGTPGTIWNYSTGETFVAGAMLRFERLKGEAAAVDAEEVVGIKTYIIELGSSLIEIFAVGTAIRKLPGMGVKTQNLPAQAIIRDKDTWLSGSGGFDLTSIRAGG